MKCAIAEKFAIGLLVFFGPVKRTNGMTVTAIVDGIFHYDFCGRAALVICSPELPFTRQQATKTPNPALGLRSVGSMD